MHNICFRVQKPRSINQLTENATSCSEIYLSESTLRNHFNPHQNSMKAINENHQKKLRKVTRRKSLLCRQNRYNSSVNAQTTVHYTLRASQCDAASNHKKATRIVIAY